MESFSEYLIRRIKKLSIFMVI